MSSPVATDENPFDGLDAVTRQAVLRQHNHAAYELYLRSAAWRAVRNAAIKRAGGACEGCGRGYLVLLDVHHRSYARLGAELPDDLCVLCRRCHDEAHGL